MHVLHQTLWPVKRKARSCGLKFQTMTQLSSEPEMSCFMLGLKHTDVTASRWPRNERSSVGSSGYIGRRRQGCWFQALATGAHVLHACMLHVTCGAPVRLRPQEAPSFFVKRNTPEGSACAG